MLLIEVTYKKPLADVEAAGGATTPELVVAVAIMKEH